MVFVLMLDPIKLENMSNIYFSSSTLSIPPEYICLFSALESDSYCPEFVILTETKLIKHPKQPELSTTYQQRHCSSHILELYLENSKSANKHPADTDKPPPDLPLSPRI